jgi:hypothetical protein
MDLALDSAPIVSRVNHKAKVYVSGNVQPNTSEGFRSLVKNGIRGGNHSVGSGHLQSYINAYAFRYSHRDDARPMFRTFEGRIVRVRAGQHGAYAPLGDPAE